MQATLERRRKALAAASRLAQQLGLPVESPRVIKDANNTIVHLAPLPVVAKMGTTTLRPDAAHLLEKELRIGRYLAARGAPIVPPADEVPAGPHLESGVAITLWRYVRPRARPAVSDAALGEMLSAFHRAFAGYPGELPDFTANLQAARAGLRDPRQAPELGDSDRSFLLEVASTVEARLPDTHAERRPLHGDPHLDGNVLQSGRGPLLIDFEAACEGPTEWDLTSLPRAALAYPRRDPKLLALLSRMRSLCVAAWCWMQYGRTPEIDEAAHFHLDALRAQRAAL